MDTPPTAVTPSRVTIERQPEGLVVTMPVPRAGCVSAFLGVWLLGWAAGEIAVISELVGQLPRFTPEVAFSLVWLAGWTAGGVAAASFLALTLAGREIVTLAPDGLHRRIEAFGVGRTRTFVPQEVEDLRVIEDRRGQPVFFGFEYRARTMRWGSGLVGDDARRIVDALLDAGSVRPSTPVARMDDRPTGT